MPVFAPEFRLLLASARAFRADESAIREILEAGIDWTGFAREATEHGVACLCGSTLARLAPELIPEDVLDAFRISIERTRQQNQAAINTLVALHEACARSKVDVITLRGPVLALQAYGDLGLRMFGRCDLLVRASDVAVASATLRAARTADGVAMNICTELSSEQMTLDMSYADLRPAAQPIELNRHVLLTPAPEDGLCLLALHGAGRRWGRIRWCCDVAAFLGAHPDLNWPTTVARARELGCLHVLAVALALARCHFGCEIPQTINGHADAAMIEPTLERIVRLWRQDLARQADKPQFVRERAEPADAAAWLEYATTLFDQKRFGEAVEASDSALRCDPTNPTARHLGVFARLRCCDWRRLEDDKRWLATCAQTHPQVIWPSLPQLFDFDQDPQFAHLAIEQIPASGHAVMPEPLWRGERYQHPEIRVAYLSAGFASDPMAALATGLFEHHDPARFDITAISLGRDIRTPMRGRIEAAARRFIQADKMSNAEVAAALRDLQVDIAVDLNGYTGKRNAAVLAFRPAPVQVNLGYPGTLALPYMDYIIADRIVIPPEHQCRFSEHVVYLPHSFQPNDHNRPTAAQTPSRADVHLPEAAFVFACFNSNYKITSAFFDSWMRLLRGVEHSVLWLLEDNVSATINLRREARARGINPSRLVFAPRVAPAKNLARQRVADLFLDTAPMNAQATASDALWVGLPVLTLQGNIFRSRVAASLLHAAGAPELVTASLIEYQELALALAHDAARLNTIKARLIRNRSSAPLFDTPRYTKYLEAAYTAMWERSRMGLRPEALALGA